MMRAVLVMAALLWACTDGNPDSGYGQGGDGGAGGAAGQGGEGGAGGTGGSAGEGGSGGEGGSLEPDAAPVDAAPPVDAEVEPGWTADGQWQGWPAAPEGSERNSDNVLCHPRCGCASATLGIPGAIDEPYEVEAGSIHDFPLHVRFGTCGPMPGVEVYGFVSRQSPDDADTSEVRMTAPLTNEDGDSVLTFEAGTVPFEFTLVARLDVPGLQLRHVVRIVPAAR